MKILLKKLFCILNLYPDKNQKWILSSVCISGLLITYSHPILLKTIISQLPAEWLAFESLAVSITALIIGAIWRGCIRKQAINYFLYLAIIESLCGCLLGLYLCFIHFNVWVFAIASLIYTTLITTFVGKCLLFFRSRLWIEKEREIYDNNNEIVGGIVCVIGYLLALIVMPSLKVALFLWAICCIIDDIGWIIVYIKEKDRLKIRDGDEKIKIN